MEDTESVPEVGVKIDPSHLFRYKSEVNPLKKKSKVGESIAVWIKK